jgi:hypothetical protein
MTAPQLAPGTVVAQKYQVGACLGYSGAAATYQAVGADRREVVLKMFDPAIRQRADIMAAIEQTYAATNALPPDMAVPLLDAGYDPATGAPFSVCERIPFPSLAQLAPQRPLTPEEAANMLGVLAQLLDGAHARQLFHHALKPTNVFIGFAQGQGVRVTDFGAGLVRAAVPTQEGYALAAPWLAPEQAQGGAPAGAAADVFSAALVLFFALTGRTYWLSTQGPLDLAGWQRELMGARTPPSARALQLGVQLNSAFDGLLGCALSLDPSQRYRTIGEMAQAFEALGSRAPESQATMAFPASALGNYPPPPPPTAAPQAGYAAAPQGYAAAPQPQQGYGAPPQPQGYAAAPQVTPYGAPAQPNVPQQPYGAPAQPQAAPQVAPPPAEPAPPAGAQPAADPNLGETAAGRPIDPAMLNQRRGSPNRLAPILVGLVALVLLGGAAAAWVVMGKRQGGPTPANSGPIAVPPPADSGSAAAPPADSGSAAAPPADSGSAAAPPADTAAPAASGEADAGAAPLESTLACDPECDEIKVDDKAIELGKPVTLAPGKHTLVASKSGFVTQKETITVKAGEKVEKTFKLVAKPTAPAGPAPAPAPAPAGKQPCGKFLKKCK